MSVPGCAGYQPSDSEEFKKYQEAQDRKDRRMEALEELYLAIKEAKESPMGYTPRVAQSMRLIEAIGK